MFRKTMFAALISLAFIAGGCGSDDPTSSTDGDMGMGDDSDMGDMDMDMDMDDMDMDDGDGHSHDEIVYSDWPTDFEEPTVILEASAVDGGDIELSIDISGFNIVSGDTEGAAANEGHVHVYVDGVEKGMFFSNDVSLTGVSPGPHQLMVELSAMDHTVLAVDGSPMRYMTEVVVPGDIEEADVTITISVDEGGATGGVHQAEASVGDLVEIVIDATIDEELHVHTYDHTAELVAGHTAVLRFEADIPGVFEIELEGLGVLVIELTVS